jgi:protease I
MRLKGKTVAVLVADGFEDLEFWVPVMRLQEEGATVVITGIEADSSFTGKHGLTATSTESARNLDPEVIDAVVVPGGWAPDKLRRDDGVKSLVRTMVDRKKIVAMICHAGWVGVSAGVLRGVRATGSIAIKDDLVNAGAQWVDEAAFRDGIFVWGRVVADIPDFCRELVTAIVDKSTEPAAAITVGGPVE